MHSDRECSRTVACRAWRSSVGAAAAVLCTWRAGAFASGGVPLQSRDALPLAAEPFAAALDLMFSAVCTLLQPRSPLIALLLSRRTSRWPRE